MSGITLEEIVLLNEFGESQAWADYYLCAPPEFVRKYRLEVKRLGQVWVTMIPGLDFPFYNRILGLGVGEAATESRLDEAIGILQDAGCKNYIAPVTPGAQPAQLPEWLTARGFTKGRNWAKVFRGAEPASPVPTTLRIESIGAAQAQVFVEVAAAAFGMPPELGPLLLGNVGRQGWRHYLAFDGEQPVSTAAMYASKDIAWLGFGSTLASHRRLGGQSALFARRIQDGLGLGCRWFLTQTGEDTPETPNPSYRNMLRAGFKLAYLRPNYIYQQL